MLNKNLTKVSGKNITWNNDRDNERVCTACCDVSDIGGYWNALLQPLFDDACDIGFTVVSHRTGKEMKFLWASDEYDSEGELIGMRFVSVTPVDGKRWCNLTVYND